MMNLLSYVQAVQGAIDTAPESMAILLWGFSLLLVSLRLRTDKTVNVVDETPRDRALIKV